MTQRPTSPIRRRLGIVAACAAITVIAACESQMPTTGGTQQTASMQRASRAVAGRDTLAAYVDSIRSLAEAAASRGGDAGADRELVSEMVDARSDASASRNAGEMTPPLAVPTPGAGATVTEVNALREHGSPVRP
jgi:hypothetical protein